MNLAATHCSAARCRMDCAPAPHDQRRNDRRWGGNGMSVEAAGVAAPGAFAHSPWYSRIKLEHVVMGGAIVALIVLVVLPLLSLLLGSLKDEHGLSLDHFSEVLSGRLYVTALKNSLILGAWTGLFSLVIGLVLAWAVSRTNVPLKPLIQVTATLSYLSPPFLTAIAFTYLFSPNAGLLNVLMRDVLGLPWLTSNIFSMAGLVLVTVLHTFPFVYLLASSALQSVDASYEEAAQILGASKLRTAFSITAPLVAPAILSGTLARLRQRARAVRLAGDHRTAGPHLHAADPHLRAVRLSAGIRARLRALAGAGADHRGGALSPARVPVAAVLRDARRQGLAAATDGARRVPLGAARLRAADLPRVDRGALRDAHRGVVLEVLGAGILEGPDARELQLHPVRVQRHPACHHQQPAARDRRGLHRGAARRDHRLDRPAHAACRAASSSTTSRSSRSGCPASWSRSR